jgi:hypothetical protein
MVAVRGGRNHFETVSGRRDPAVDRSEAGSRGNLRLIDKRIGALRYQMFTLPKRFSSVIVSLYDDRVCGVPVIRAGQRASM